MRILITNDDGINAPGLKIAESIAAEIAGPEGEIWVIAPENERSGASHAISYTQPTRLNQLGERRFALDGYPADCALVGLHKILKDTPPDLLISGVNRGHNVAEDVFYSGTVGAAMDGALAGIQAIALSQFYSKGSQGHLFASSTAHGAEAVRKVLQMPFPSGVFYNVNFPATTAEGIAGMTVCPQGLRADTTFDVISHTAPNGREYQFYRHGTRNASAPEGTDARLCHDGWITITPLALQLTANTVLDAARATLG